MHVAQNEIPLLQINSLWGSIDQGAMTDTIAQFRKLDLDSEIVDFVLNPDSYYFPQSVESPGELLQIEEDKIAILALANSQTQRLAGGHHLHHHQKRSLARNGFSAIEIEARDKQLREIDFIAGSNGGAKGTARVWDVAIDDASGLLIHSKPTLILNVDANTQELVTDPPMIVHELVHLAQNIGRVLFTDTKRTKYTNEIEACVVQSRSAQKDARLPYTSCSEYAGEVANYRDRFIGPDSYEPTLEFMRATQNHRVLSKVFI